MAFLRSPLRVTVFILFGAILLISLVCAFFIVPSSVQTNVDALSGNSSAQFSTSSSDAVGSTSMTDADTELFSRVVSLGNGVLPLRSQHAIASWNDAPLVVLMDGKDIFVVEANGDRHRVVTTQPMSSPTIAASGDRVVVAWVTRTAIMAASSADLVTWSTPEVVGERKNDGGPIPSVDWTGTKFAVVWVDAPKTNALTGGMDGVGALQVAVGDGVGAWKLSTVNSTTAIVAISESTLVWRDDRGATSSDSMDSVRMANLDGSNETIVCSGYDPAISVDGDAVAIGYHINAEAHLRTTVDKKIWNDTVIDTTGKFVSPIAFGGIFGATWVDYVDAAAAQDARNDAGHRVTTVWDGVEYFMNDGASKTLQGQADVIGGVPAVVYTVDGTVYLAY